MTFSLRTFTIGLITLGGLAACGDDGDDDDFDGVRINARDVYKTAAGEATALSPETGRNTFTVHSSASGTAAAYPGTLGAEGEVRVPGVPAGPYLLELTTPPSTAGGVTFRSFFEFSQREVDFSSMRSYRPDVQSMTLPTYLMLNTPLTRPWQAGAIDEQGDELIALDDNLYAYSRNAFVVGYASGGERPIPEAPAGVGAPANGAASLAWQLDLKTMVGVLYGPNSRVEHLIDASKGDDFRLLHLAAKPVRAASPPPAGGGNDPFRAYAYKSVEAALTPAPFTMTDGGTTAIEGAFAAVPQKTFTLNYQGAAFNDLLRDVPTTTFSSTALAFSVYHEPNVPEPADGAFGELLRFDVSSSFQYVDPICNPGNETDEGVRVCDDTAACPAGCNDQRVLTLPGDHAHTYSYGNPFEGGQELAALVYSFNSHFGEAVTSSTANRQLRGQFYVLGPAAEFNNVPFAPVISLPRNVTLKGQPAPVGALTPGVGLTPTISFEPPALGAPYSYRVLVRKVVVDRSNPNYETASSTSIATFMLQGTTLTLPTGLLEAGATYYLQVEASVRDPSPSGSILRYGPHFASAMTFSGVFTP